VGYFFSFWWPSASFKNNRVTGSLLDKKTLIIMFCRNPLEDLFRAPATGRQGLSEPRQHS
jgi:hypothetical protein